MARYVPKKTLSFFAAGTLAIGCTVGWGAFIMPGTTFLPKAGPLGTAIALLLAAALVSVIAVNYRYLMRKLPYDGGSFAFTNEAFGRIPSYICGWSLAIAYLVIIPANATALPLLFRGLKLDFLQQGPWYSAAGYDSYLFEMLAIAALLTVLSLVAAYGGKRAFQLEGVLVVCMAAGFVALCIAVIAGSGGAALQAEPAFHPDVDPVLGIVGITAIAPWIFIGFGSVSQMAGEFTFSPGKAGLLVVTALAMAAGTYLVMNTIAAAMPANQGSWVDFTASTSTLSGTYGFPLFTSVERLAGPFGSFALGITMFSAIASGILGFFLVTSRLLASMARRGVLSDWFGQLSWPERRPLHAMLFLFVASLLLAAFGRTMLQWITSVSSVGAAIAFLFTCASARSFARKDGNRGVTVTATAGMAISCLFLAVLIAPIPQIGVALGQESYLFLVAWVALGINFYTPDVPHYDPEKEQIAIADLAEFPDW